MQYTRHSPDQRRVPDKLCHLAGKGEEVIKSDS